MSDETPQTPQGEQTQVSSTKGVPKPRFPEEWQIFARATISGMSRGAAYLEAYPSSAQCTDKTRREMGSRLARRPEVIEIMKEIRRPLNESAAYALADAMAECDEAIKLSRKKKDAKAFVAAVTLKSRLNGLLVEDRRNSLNPLSHLTDEQLESYNRRLENERQSITGKGPDSAGDAAPDAGEPPPALPSLH